jgi:hypothetical protein
VPTRTRRQILALRRDEPWYPAAAAGFEAIAAGRARRADRIAVTPMSYSRWDAAAQAHQAAEASQRNNQAARIFNSELSRASTAYHDDGRGRWPARL